MTIGNGIQGFRSNSYTSVVLHFNRQTLQDLSTLENEVTNLFRHIGIRLPIDARHIREEQTSLRHRLTFQRWHLQVLGTESRLDPEYNFLSNVASQLLKLACRANEVTL